MFPLSACCLCAVSLSFFLREKWHQVRTPPGNSARPLGAEQAPGMGSLLAGRLDWVRCHSWRSAQDALKFRGGGVQPAAEESTAWASATETLSKTRLKTALNYLISEPDSSSQPAPCCRGAHASDGVWHTHLLPEPAWWTQRGTQGGTWLPEAATSLPGVLLGVLTAHGRLLAAAPAAGRVKHAKQNMTTAMTLSPFGRDFKTGGGEE